MNLEQVAVPRGAAAMLFGRGRGGGAIDQMADDRSRDCAGLRQEDYRAAL